jgi:hypothetical protein
MGVSDREGIIPGVALMMSRQGEHMSESSWSLC